MHYGIATVDRLAQNIIAIGAVKTMMRAPNSSFFRFP